MLTVSYALPMPSATAIVHSTDLFLLFMLCSAVLVLYGDVWNIVCDVC